MKILLIEESAADARLVRDALAPGGESVFAIRHATRLSEGLAALADESFDAIILDLWLPDSRGIDSIAQLLVAAAAVPIVVLSAQQDETLALQAVRRGAQDYLVKGEWDAKLLLRVLRYAVERKHAEQYISHLAYHDGLTNLPNRRLFLDRLEQALALARRTGRTLALLFLDIDRFKAVNDTAGHGAGDQLLRHIAERLKASTRASDTVARVGGDEFTVVLSEVSRTDDVVAYVEKLLEHLRAPLAVGAQSLAVTASVGISLYPEDGDTAEMLLDRADRAMYLAKEEGRDNYRFYLPERNTFATEQAALAHDLGGALARGEFRLFYQPIIDVRATQPCGMEALLRWVHPERGVVAPRQFLPLAVTAGCDAAIGEWTLEQAVRQADAWTDAGLAAGPIHVNLLDRQLGHRACIQELVRLAERHAGVARRVVLEIGEGDLLRMGTAGQAALTRVGELGYRVALDGFGSADSGIVRLARLRLAAIKLDASLLDRPGQVAPDASLVGAIVAFARTLGLRTIAVGVEDAEQLAFLRDAGCDAVQGEFIAGARDAGAATRFLEEHAGRGGR